MYTPITVSMSDKVNIQPTQSPPSDVDIQIFNGYSNVYIPKNRVASSPSFHIHRLYKYPNECQRN